MKTAFHNRLISKFIHRYTGWPKKVHFQESSLNCIKNRQFGYISHQF